jgi:hypothetical protein
MDQCTPHTQGIDMLESLAAFEERMRALEQEYEETRRGERERVRFQQRQARDGFLVPAVVLKCILPKNEL